MEKEIKILQKRVEELELRVQGDLERKIRWEEKLRKEFADQQEKYERKIKELNERVELAEKKIELKEKKFLKIEDVDKEKTLIIKRGWKWNGEKVRDWLDAQIGKEEWESKPMENGIGMMWLIFKDAFVQRYLWRKADRAAKEGIFILDEVLTAAQRKERWTGKHSKGSGLVKEEKEE